jgi:hypothetical protein
MPESLGRNGQRVCADCATAHRAIAGHLKQMFAAPPVDRVSSVRAKLFNQIFGAAEELADKDGTPPEQSPHHAHNSVHLPRCCVRRNAAQCRAWARQTERKEVAIVEAKARLILRITKSRELCGGY